MKTFRKSIVIFFLFMLGTMAVMHVDRQCRALEGGGTTIAEQITEELKATAERFD